MIQPVALTILILLLLSLVVVVVVVVVALKVQPCLEYKIIGCEEDLLRVVRVHKDVNL